MKNSRKKRRDAIRARGTEWQDVYQLPLHLDKYGCYAWCKNGTMAITFEHYDRLVTDSEWAEGETRAKEIISYINGEKNCFEKGWTHQTCDFYLDGKYMFCVRGWGHLIGTGGLNLPIDEAERIQDGFIDYIQRCLTYKGLSL